MCTLPAICATHSQHLPRPRDLDSNFPEKMGRGLAWMPDLKTTKILRQLLRTRGLLQVLGLF